MPVAPLPFLLGFAYSNGFCWTQVYADATSGALDDVDDLGFTVFAFFQNALGANTYADEPCAGHTLSRVD
jgi:hypothetical protein